MPDATTAIIGAFIKAKREALGISQAELCRRIYGNHSSKDQISKIEAGLKSITTKTLDKYMAALNSSINFIEY